MKQINTIELFAGSCSFSKTAKKLNMNTFTTDILDLENIDYVCNIFDFDIARPRLIPDLIWASPDCSTFSKAAGNLHFNSKSLKPKTEKAVLSLKMIDKTLEIISTYLILNPNLKFYIENPEGKLKYYISRGTLFEKFLNIPRIVTIDQCQYGKSYKKPTSIFTNDFNWQPRKRCTNLAENCHSNNSAITNLSGRRKYKGDLDRYYKVASIPTQLLTDILTQYL